MNKSHVVCYSGGHSSALVAIEVFRRFGNRSLHLLNHNIHPDVEDPDIKRFKKAVASYCRTEVEYANMPDWDKKDQFDVVIENGAFKLGTRYALCTNRMKTRPFEKWLDEVFPVRTGANEQCVIYYGFDAKETGRIQRRASHLGQMGYKTDFPLAFWERTIESTNEVGIEPPCTYGVFKHANCVGCLKAKKQHWYCVYCLRYDLFEKGKHAEDVIGYSIMPNLYLDEIEPTFEQMKELGIRPTEHIDPRTFWAGVKKLLATKEVERLAEEDQSSLPCECIF